MWIGVFAMGLVFRVFRLAGGWLAGYLVVLFYIGLGSDVVPFFCLAAGGPGSYILLRNLYSWTAYLAMNPVCCRGSVSLYLPWALYLEYSGWWLAGGWLVTWLCYLIQAPARAQRAPSSLSPYLPMDPVAVDAIFSCVPCI